MSQSIIATYVDQALAFTARYHAYLMYENEPVPASMAAAPPMLDALPRHMMMEHPESDGLLLEKASGDNHFWTPVASEVSESDIREIEQLYAIRLPDSYKAYLQYKHFYTIFIQPAIKLYPKPVEGWKAILCDHNDEMREDLLDQGYFAIGEYNDYGAICFDLKHTPGDCRVVMIDYACGVPETEEDIEILGSNFVAFLETIVEQGEATVRDLKGWEQRIYNR